MHGWANQTEFLVNGIVLHKGSSQVQLSDFVIAVERNWEFPDIYNICGDGYTSNISD